MDFSKIKNNLESFGYKVNIFDEVSEANEYLNSNINNKTIGIGGSVTIDQMGIYDSLSSHNKVIWHWKPLEGVSSQEMRKLTQTADIYFSSVNGISETGEIVNIDNNCDRVSNILFGHEKVYFIVGKNKIAPDLEQAIYRARNIAGPLNAKRLNRKTPCAIKGDKCYNCKSPDRICRGLSVLWQKPAGCEYEVILINKNLGY